MRYVTNFGVLSFAFLLRSVAALPGGCGGSLGIMDIQSPNFKQLVWTCADINPGSLFSSRQNFLIATYTTPDDQTCGNKCASWKGVANLMAAIRYYNNDSCQCWEIGDIAYNVLPATSASSNGTFIDFYDLGVATPSSSQNWGIFTCPEGSWSAVTPYDLGQPGVGACGWITVIPAQPAIASLGLVGAGMCRDIYHAQYAIADAKSEVTCYNDLAGAKYHFNYSSPSTLFDLVDFLLPPSTSTSSKSSVKSTSSKSSVKSTSSMKSTSRSTTTSKSSVKSTSTTKSTSKLTSTSTHKLTTSSTTKHTSSSTTKKSSTKSS